MVDLWTSIGISPSGSTILAYDISNNKIYYSSNNSNVFMESEFSSNISDEITEISVIDISYVLCCSKQNIYLSTNNGIHFSKVFGIDDNEQSSNDWSGVSISSDTGKYMVACIGSKIYLSADFGSNWEVVLSSSINTNFTSISISETGKYIVACYTVSTNIGGGGIYTSSDYGSSNSWLDNQTIPINLNWSSICIKEKYSFAVACDTSGYIYTSTSNGNIWVDASLNLPITTNFKKVCISDYGYAVALSNINMLVTENYGENWTIKPVYNNITTVRDIGVSRNGLLVMCDISNIYSSSIYSVYNDPKKYYSTDVSFVTKGLLDNQVDISNILNTSFRLNFQNPTILPNNYNIVVQNSVSTDPFQNIQIPNRYNQLDISGLRENTEYIIKLESIYPNVISTIYKQQYTKGSPIDVKVDIDNITDTSMNISFNNCPFIPESYTINILNQGSSTDFSNILLTNIQQQSLIPYTLTNLSPDSKYKLTITSNYKDVSYSSIPITDILTKSAPSNISYTLQTGNKVEITYSIPSYVIPNTITIFLYNVTNNNSEIKSDPQSSVNTSYIFEDLSVNSTYNIILQSNYENMVVKSSPITFTNLGKPTIIASYRFDNNPEVQKYIITTNIFLASKPTYLINFQYPKTYEILYGISYETFDLPVNSTSFDLYNIDIFGEYIVTVSAIFDINTTILSDPFKLTLKQRPIIQFGNIDISYTYVNIPYTIYEYADPPSNYTLYLKNTLYSYIYDQSYNITNLLTDTTNSYITKFNTFAGTGNYRIYITDGMFYSDYINITVPEIITVAIDYTKTDKSKTNKLTVTYNTLQIIKDSSYTLFVNGNVSYPNISFSSSTVDPSLHKLSVDVTILGTMNYYIIHYFPDGSIYRTPSGTQKFESDTIITFGTIDIYDNYFIVPISITTFAFLPRYAISIYSESFVELSKTLYINTSTVVSNTNSRFNVYANTGNYYISLTDGKNKNVPDPSFITLPTILNTLSDISYIFTTSTTTTNTNTNTLNVSYYILNTYDPSYTLYLKNKNVNDISFSIYSTTSIAPELFVPTSRSFIEITDKITRSGIYSFYIKHDYTGVLNNTKSRISYISPSSEVLINISNIVDLSYVSVSSTNLINIQSTITSFDMTPLTYKLYLQSISFSKDLSYSYNITIPIRNDYDNINKDIKSIDFSNIYVNTGKYTYYIIDSSGREYRNASYSLTLPTQTSTFKFIGDLSVNYLGSDTYASISTLYSITHESYKPTYSIVATNTTMNNVNDCSYSASVYMDNASTIINRVTDISYPIEVSNIYRTGLYSVYLQNNYNGTGIRSSNYKETTLSKNIYVYLPNSVDYGQLTYDISSVTIPFTITAYDISDVLYNVVITNNSVSSSDISYSQSFTLANNHIYNSANVLNNTIYFRNLFVNSGTYSYKVYNNNGFTYPGPGSTFTLPSISTTFYLRYSDTTSNTYDTYSSTNIGSITTKYDISYLTYGSTYKVVAIHKDLTDCSFTNSIVGIQKYSDINNPYSLSIPNIFRTGTYTVYLQNIYNNNTSIETTSSKDILVNLPNNVAYTNVAFDCSSITLPITVTSHDISFVTYTVYLKNTALNDISYNQTFIVWNDNRNYSNATIYGSTFLFKNLYANSGTYSYYVVGSKTYSGNNITVPNVTTIALRDLSSTMFDTYSSGSSGKIIARYDISYVSYQSKYKLNLTHRVQSNCSYNTYAVNIPSQNSDIHNPYDVSFSNIYRTGIYSVYIENEYTNTGSNFVDKTNTIDISVNLPNDISYTSVTRDVSSISINITNKCFDISNAYTVTILNNSITTDISYNVRFSVLDNNDYTAPITTTESFVFPNLYANTGYYSYYVTDLYGNRYPSIDSTSNQILLPTSNTLTLRDVSSTRFDTYSSTNNGSITVKYDISYISYKPTYTLQVVSDILNDCSFSISISGPSNYSNIYNTYILSISNIFRTGIYHVYLKNSYNNGLGSEQYTRDISVNLPNDVSYQLVTADTTSIVFNFEITSFDISATDYKLNIKNAYSDDLSSNQTFTIPYSRNYSAKNVLSVQDCSFQNLAANSGRYYYYFTNSNGINYPSIINSKYIDLLKLDNTIELLNLLSTMYTVYSSTNIGSITGRYQIIAKSNNPTYTLIATNKVLNDCSYSVAITGANIPSNIKTPYNLVISPIYRTGIYSVLLQNKYIGGIEPENSNTIDISVNLPNDISYTSITSDISYITINYKITSFDISNVIYTAYIKDISFTDLTYNQEYTLVNSTNYSGPTTYTSGSFTFRNLLANTGKYNYYFIDSNGVRYPANDTTNNITLKTATNTISLTSVSATNSDVSGSITANYNISYLTYNPNYKIIAKNNTISGVTDCSYVVTVTNVPTTYAAILSSYNLSISNIKRSGNYQVILQNTYNGGNIETSATKNILVNIPNKVTYDTVGFDISAITVPFTITSYDISNVTYNVTIKDVSFTSLTYVSSKNFVVNNSTDYTKENSLNDSFKFTNLLANTGNYYYYITNTTNNVRYPTSDSTENMISLPVTNTIVLNSVSAANSDVSGSITANYNILYLTYSPTYKIIATNNTISGVTDCSYVVTVTNVPATYSAIVSSYNLSVSNIKRSGNYQVILQNTYNGGSIETSATKNILVNIPNTVTYGTVGFDVSAITVPFTITSYDISNVTYTVTVQDVSFADLIYSQEYTLNNSNSYNAANIYNGNFKFTNLLANTGKYNYYITNTNGVRYPANDTTNNITLKTATTISLTSVSAANSDVSGSITANYNILYLTYSPTYKIIATNNTISGVTDCSYVVTVSNAPTTYAAILSSYNLSISNIKRSGNYQVILQNTYNGGNIETSATKNILVNIPNTVTYGTVTSDISYITVPFTITSYDISNVIYTVRIRDVSFTDLSYSQEYTLNNSNSYNVANIYNGNFKFTNLLANTGKYNYYITNTNGVRYPATDTTNNITLKTATTISLTSVSAANSDVSGSITANYSFLYLTYNPNYKIIAKNNTISEVTDCSYAVTVSNVPTTYAAILSSYNLSVSNIKRSGNYQVILQNTYNGGNIETSATKNILVNIPNTVTYGTVTSDISYITVPFTITSYDISNVIYTVRIRDVSFTDLSYNSSDFVVNNSTDYTSATIYDGSFTFQNLFVNTGKYNYYITNSTGRYPAADTTNTISLKPVARTITLKEVSSNILSTYSATNSGRITAKYDISYVSYAPKYKVTAVHKSAPDCSYTNSTTIGLPSSYTIDISNIYRSGIYNVYLQNISGSIEQTNSLDISVNLPNDVSFIKVTNDNYSIDISFQITTYDISLVNYDLCIQNAKNPDVSYSITYPVYPTRDYTKPTTNIYHSVFTGLTVSGDYNYYMIDSSNNKTYTGSSIFIIGDYVYIPPPYMVLWIDTKDANVYTATNTINDKSGLTHNATGSGLNTILSKPNPIDGGISFTETTHTILYRDLSITIDNYVWSTFVVLNMVNSNNKSITLLVSDVYGSQQIVISTLQNNTKVIVVGYYRTGPIEIDTSNFNTISSFSYDSPFILSIILVTTSSTNVSVTINVNGYPLYSNNMTYSNKPVGTNYSTLVNQSTSTPIKLYELLSYNYLNTYSYAHTTEQIQKIEGYLASKWNLISKLPANHLYKTNAAPGSPL